MKKNEIVALIAERSGLSKAQANKVFDETFLVLKEELVKGETVLVPGFGTFKVSLRAARDGINPLTKEKIHIDEKKAVTFKASKTLKDELN